VEISLQHKHVEVNGIQLHYVTAGSGPLLLLLHGFPEFWYSWRQQIERFSTHYTVVAPDLRGFNDSDKPSWGYDADVLLSDVCGIMDALGFRQASVAGHDRGGFLAWAMAILYPHRVDKLVILNTPHPAIQQQALQTTWKMKIKTAALSLLQLPILPEMLFSVGDYALIEWLLRGNLIHKHALRDEEIAYYKDAISKPGALTAALNWYRYSCMHTRLVEQHPAFLLYQGKSMQVTAPTLMFWSQHEQDTDLALTYTTENYVPDLHIVTIPNCSHRILHERPDLVNRFMEDFLL
jgi:pimeloyl-ACP methyl ester carboxylesterase